MPSVHALPRPSSGRGFRIAAACLCLLLGVAGTGRAGEAAIPPAAGGQLAPQGLQVESIEKEDGNTVITGSCSSQRDVANFASALLANGIYGKKLVMLTCKDGRFRIVIAREEN